MLTIRENTPANACLIDVYARVQKHNRKLGRFKSRLDRLFDEFASDVSPFRAFEHLDDDIRTMFPVEALMPAAGYYGKLPKLLINVQEVISSDSDYEGENYSC